MLRMLKLLVLAFGGAVLTAPPAGAMAFYSTADPNFNTTAPTGALAGSGWQWVGTWGGFQGVPIDAHHFLAANHVGGTVGDPFVLNDVTYTTVNTFGDASTDLRIWEVRETFPAWAPIYRNGDEIGRGLVVFGRGVTRGTEVRTAVAVPGVPVNSLAGWQWGSGDGRLRWGQNTVVETVNPTPFGEQLYAQFNKLAGANECHLGIGDSSGPVFIDDGDGWKLAGVAGMVDSYFNTTNTGDGFNAFIFDARGLYFGDSGNWTLGSGPSPIPSGFYATRVSVRAAWIDSVLAGPLTATVILANLAQTYDGAPHPVAVTTDPAGLATTVAYNGDTAVPTEVGSYAVVVTVTASGYTGTASGTLTIAPAAPPPDGGNDVPLFTGAEEALLLVLLAGVGLAFLRRSSALQNSP